MNAEEMIEIIKFAAAQPAPRFILVRKSVEAELEAFLKWEHADRRRLKREMRKARERAKK